LEPGHIQKRQIIWAIK